MTQFLPSVDPSLPQPGPEATEYQRELDRRLRELFIQLLARTEPLARYKVDATVLTANDEELGGVEWAAAAGGGGGADHYYDYGIRYMTYNQGSTTPSQVGVTFTASGGSAAAGTVASTNLRTSLPRLEQTMAASANQTTGLNSSNSAAFWLGNAADLGGFRAMFIFGTVTTGSGNRVAVGMGGGFGLTAAATDPSSANTDCVFIGADAGDTNLQIMHNDASGTCTKVDLGSNFAKATNNMVLRLDLHCLPNASSIDYTVTRLDTGDTTSGTLSTDLPTNTAFMAPYFRFGSGTTTTQCTYCSMEFRGINGAHRLS